MTIDVHLDSYATESIADGESYRWWWNGCDVLADAISSLARHVRVDGCHLFEDGEKEQLEALERYMAAWPDLNHIGARETMWLHCEAMWLLGQWFSRLWD